MPERRYELSESVQLDRAGGNVIKALEQARAYVADKQYGEGVGILMQVMDASGGKLVRVAPTRYLPVRAACQLRFVSLPPEGLALYRRRVDPEAKRLYEEGLAQRDRRRLLEVADHYLASSWADQALDVLGEMALESGDPAAARSFWERTVPIAESAGQSEAARVADPSHKAANAKGDPQPIAGRVGDPSYLAVPDTDLDLAAVRARLVLASILEGSAWRAADELARYTKLHPDARGWLGGRQVRYVDALTNLIAESARWPRPAHGSDWPTFAGSPSRNAVAATAPDVADPVWRVALRRAEGTRKLGAEPVSRPARVAEDVKNPLSFFPVVSGGRVFVNKGNEEILALDLATGRPAWGSNAAVFQQEMENQSAKDRRASEGLGVARFTATVFGDRLYARMGSPITSRPHGAAASANAGFLIALDLASQGRLAWKAEPEPGWAFEGSPVADASGVYVAMRRSEVQPQAYVACFDAEGGQLRWRQFVCAADTPARGVLPEITHSLLTLHRDALYVNTNLGAVASLDATDGRLRWVSLYPRDLKGDLAKPPPHACRDLAPCLVDRGQIYIAPADARSVFALDAASGQVLWQSGPELEDVVHLLGVANDSLIASGNRLYWIGLKESEQGRVKHVWPDGAAKLGYGRGLLAGGCVLWPTREKIYVFDQATGRPKKAVDLTPRGASGGNLLVAGGRLLIATPQELIALGGPAVENARPAVADLRNAIVGSSEVVAARRR